MCILLIETILFALGQPPWIHHQRQHPTGRVEGVAGCGLVAETTTSLARLGYDSAVPSVEQALLNTVEEATGRSIN